MNNMGNIRKERLADRDLLTMSQQQKKSNVICQRLTDVEAVKQAQHILVYVSFRSEVETLRLIDQLLLEEKKVSVPVTLVSDKKLLAVTITDRDKDLVPGYCEIPEPRKELIKINTIDPGLLDVILMPGSVFDERGGRYGYGGGYYDRFVSKEAPGAYRIGLAYELQICTRIDLHPHDELVDLVVTEERMFVGDNRNLNKD